MNYLGRCSGMQITIPSLYACKYDAKVISLDEPYERERFRISLDIYDKTAIYHCGAKLSPTGPLVCLDRNNQTEYDALPMLIDVCGNSAFWVVRMIGGCTHAAVANAMMIMDPRWEIFAVGIGRDLGHIFLGGILTLRELSALDQGEFPRSLEKLGSIGPGFRNGKLLDSSMNVLDPTWKRRILERGGRIPDETQRWKARELSMEDNFQPRLKTGRDPYNGAMILDYEKIEKDRSTQRNAPSLHHDDDMVKDDHKFAKNSYPGSYNYNHNDTSSHYTTNHHDDRVSRKRPGRGDIQYHATTPYDNKEKGGRRPHDAENDLDSDGKLHPIKKGHGNEKRGNIRGGYPMSDAGLNSRSSNESYSSAFEEQPDADDGNHIALDYYPGMGKY